MADTLSFSLLCLTSFFTLINPLGTMPVFLSMTSALTPEMRRKTAKKAVLTAFITALVFALSGQFLFKFFAITADSFRIVGGVIFFRMGSEMLAARISPLKLAEDEVKDYVTDISITPLGIPMICGPGAITNAIVLMEDAHNLLAKALVVIAMALVLGLTYGILIGSEWIQQKLGSAGNKILMRLMGLIVMVIAVEFFFAGLKPIWQDIIAIAAK